MHSLRVKLIAPFLVGTLALTLLLAWYTYSSARQAVEDAMLLISEAKTNQAAGSMALLYKSAFSNLQNMVVDPHVTEVFTHDPYARTVQARTAEWLEILIQGNEYYRDIFIVDDKGICVASSNPGQINRSYINADYVIDALNGIFTLGESSVGKVTKNFSTVIAGPVDVGGRVAGALVLLNDFPKIVDYESHAAQGAETVFTSMLTPSGLFAAHKDRGLMANSKMLFPSLYAELAPLAEHGAIVEYRFADKDYIGYAKVDPTSKWIILTSGVEDEVFASAYRVGFTVFGISMAFLLVISFVVFRVANGILRSLLSLIGYAKHVSEGDLDLKLEDTRRNDELGVLHVSLQRLVQSLQSMLIETRKAARTKEQFLANMSHEIRTPLNAVIGMTHLSLRDQGISEKQRGYLDKIQVASLSLLGLINDILDLSKIEAGMLELEEISFSLRETVENVLSIHQESARSKGLELTMRYAPELPPYFIGDPLRIGQVLNNLLSNALKFTSSGGIGVDIRALERPGAKGANPSAPLLVQVSVRDSGIGIAQEKLDALFQPFTQADASTSRRYGGTGLGLAISDKIVHLLGGSFDVRSEPAKGTTFVFTMRLIADMSEHVERDAELPLDEAFAQLRLEGKRILVAEDNAVNQLIMRELIEPSGAEVVMAENGSEAVQAVSSGSFDLVFMDMQMPIMDGLEATRTIRTFADMATLPIIAVTANAMKEDKELSFAGGMNDYITKPVDPRQLLEMLRVWIKPPPDGPGASS